MKNLMILSCFFIAGFTFADGHSAAEQQVLKSLESYFDARNKSWWELPEYLTRHIYADQKSGDRNNAGTKIWGFF